MPCFLSEKQFRGTGVARRLEIERKAEPEITRICDIKTA